jgi:hypothetical protein
MGKAALYVDKGFSFKLEGENVKGITTLGGVEVEVTIENGEIVYHYGNSNSTDPNVIAAQIMKDSNSAKDFEVGTYKLPDGKILKVE